jgi:hypothetical protein
MGEGGTVHGGFIDADELKKMHPELPDVNVPTVSDHQLPMNDEDAQQCVNVSVWGLSPTYLPYKPEYVDNVVSFSFQPSDPWGFGGIENDPIHVTLASGHQASIPRNWIINGGTAATGYRKSQGIVYPSDELGSTYLLNATNTPNLVALDNYILALTKRAAQERYEIAEIVAAFAENIASLGHMGEHSNEILEHVHHYGHPHGE